MSGRKDGYDPVFNIKEFFLDLDLGKLCIEVKASDKIAFISEFLCIGCGICVKKYARFTSIRSLPQLLLVDVRLRQSLLSIYLRTWILK